MDLSKGNKQSWQVIDSETTLIIKNITNDIFMSKVQILYDQQKGLLRDLGTDPSVITP